MADPLAFVDLRAQHDELRAELDAAFRATVDTSAFIGGAVHDRFEADWAAYCGTTHAVGVANGTDALELAFGALGIGPGDEVIVPTNTFVATAEAVTAVGAVPVFVDVDPETFLLTADAVAAAVSPRTAAVAAVHLYGQMVDLGAVGAVARRHGLALVEDAAQAHGARWRGHRPGVLGDIAAYSFYPGKNLGALGDGGAVVTNDAALADKVRLLSTHGRSTTDRHRHVVDGRNSRLDGLQAALLAVKLTALDRWNERRRAIHARYVEHLGGDQRIRMARVAEKAEAVHHLEPVLLPDRDRAAAALAAAGVPTGLHYPICCHEQEPFAHHRRLDVAVAEHAARHELSLPMHPHLADADVERVCEALLAALDAGGAP